MPDTERTGLWMRFFLAVGLLVMLALGLFQATTLDEGLKQGLLVLVTMAIGYFFGASKGGTDAQRAITDLMPQKGSTTVLSTANKQTETTEP